MNYKNRYIKYKTKYLILKQKGGSEKSNLTSSHFDLNLHIDSQNNLLENPETINYDTAVIQRKQKYGVWINLPNELHVIGDIHGDFFALKQVLELTKCVIFSEYTDKIQYNPNSKMYFLNDGCDYYNIENNNIMWNPSKRNCFIVFAGDIIDRCRPNINNLNCINTVNDENCDYKILKLLLDLDKQAQNYGSRIILVLGNHEMLNIDNDFRYVSPKGMADKNRNKNLYGLLQENKNNIFGMIRINHYIIVHGGINDKYFEKLDKKYNKYYEININLESIEIFNYHLRNYIFNDIKSELDNTYLHLSPFWDRTLGGVDSLNINQCKKIFNDNILKIIPYKIIVAHCPQFNVNKTVNLVDCQEYKNKIYRIDVGMSRSLDLYDFEKINNILNKNINIIFKTNPKDFYIIDIHSHIRYANYLKITQTYEVLIKGKITLDYFYETAFSNQLDKILYLLSDVKKICIKNIKLDPLNMNNYNLINKINNIFNLFNK